MYEESKMPIPKNGNRVGTTSLKSSQYRHDALRAPLSSLTSSLTQSTVEWSRLNLSGSEGLNEVSPIFFRERLNHDLVNAETKD